MRVRLIPGALLVAASMVATPLAVLAQDANSGRHAFGLRGTERGNRPPTEQGSRAANRVLYPRAFAPVIPDLGLSRRFAAFGPDTLATPQGAIRLGNLPDLPPHFSLALQGENGPHDAAVLHFGEFSQAEVRQILASTDVQVLDRRPTNAFIATGLTPAAQAIFARNGVTVLTYSSGLFASPGIGTSSLLCPNPSSVARSRSHVSFVMMNALMPLFPLPGEVTAAMMNTSPTPACVIHVFWPLRTYFAPFLTAVVSMRLASDPEPGSVSPNPPNTWPLARGVR